MTNLSIFSDMKIIQTLNRTKTSTFYKVKLKNNNNKNRIQHLQIIS